MTDNLSERLRYNDWANGTLYGAMKAKDAPESALRAFQHVLETEVTWSGRILGREGANVPLWGPASWAQCDDWLATARRQLGEVAAEHAADGFARTFTYRNSSGREFEDSVRDVLEHMLLHSAQYRGESAGFSNAAGKQMPDLDYIFWLRAGKPATPEA